MGEVGQRRITREASTHIIIFASHDPNLEHFSGTRASVYHYKLLVIHCYFSCCDGPEHDIVRVKCPEHDIYLTFISTTSFEM